MSSISKVIAPCCNKKPHGNDDHSFNWNGSPPATYIGDGDYAFVHVASMEADGDDDDDGGYDYAPAA
nr:IRON MAN 4 [Lotus japonicus]